MAPPAGETELPLLEGDLCISKRVMRKFVLKAALQRNANFLLPLGGEGQDEGASTPLTPALSLKGRGSIRFEPQAYKSGKVSSQELNLFSAYAKVSFTEGEL